MIAQCEPKVREPANRPSGRNRNLVIVRAGRASLHRGWLTNPTRSTFDLLVAYYESAEANVAAEWSIELPGRKIEGYHQIFLRHPEFLDNYDFIALLDDDLDTNQDDLDRLFAMGGAYRLDLFQPSLSWDSHFSYAATLHAGRAYRLRYTNTVEMMAPVFRASYLKSVLRLFGLGFETGIDLVWTKAGSPSLYRFAIVDDVVVRHTRPIGSTQRQQGFGPGGYNAQIAAVLKRSNARFSGYVSYAAVDRRGRLILSRYVIAGHSLNMWRAWRHTPLSPRTFLRKASDFTRHCFFRPLNLEPIDLEKTVQGL